MNAINVPLFGAMEPTLLIIPLIAVTIWVLQYLFRSANEKKLNDRGRSSSRSSKPRRQDTKFDRYLEEERREREREKERSKSRRTQPTRSAPLPVLEVAPEERGSLERRLEAREAREPKHVDKPAVAAVAVPVQPDAPIAPRQLGKVRPQSATVLELARLLRSPVSIRAAIILNEVLGPPLAKRTAPPGRPL